MKIYTKTGDSGETGLYGGSRVPKDNTRIQVYGTLDELNAVLGVVSTDSSLDLGVKESLRHIQDDLFALGSELATPPGKENPTKKIYKEDISRLEAEIDRMEEQLPPLKNFILPGGCRAGAETHLARTVCRRAERWVTQLAREVELRSEVVIYLNRLSDHLFVMARFINHSNDVEEIPWRGK